MIFNNLINLNNLLIYQIINNWISNSSNCKRQYKLININKSINLILSIDTFIKKLYLLKRFFQKYSISHGIKDLLSLISLFY